MCAEAGAHAGIVDISTFNVINAAMASDAGAGPPSADWLLVNVASDYASIAILRGQHLVLFRSRGADTEGTLADLVHQTAMYYEDRLNGGGFSRVLLSGASATGVRQSADVDQMRRSLEERLGKAVEAVDPREAVGLTDRVTATPVVSRYARAARRPAAARSPGQGGMIRTNLSTRPFYNESAVRIWIAIIFAVAAVATVFNVSRVLHYSRNETQLALQASHDEATAADFRGRAARERAAVDLKEIAAESARAREANDLIDRRTFSWTELFNRFETTLPPDVRITTVRPRLDAKDHHMVLDIRVIARSVDDINQFMENLEATGAFQRLNPDDTRANEAGLFESSITMRYPRAAQTRRHPSAGR